MKYKTYLCWEPSDNLTRAFWLGGEFFCRSWPIELKNLFKFFGISWESVILLSSMSNEEWVLVLVLFLEYVILWIPCHIALKFLVFSCFYKVHWFIAILLERWFFNLAWRYVVLKSRSQYLILFNLRYKQTVLNMKEVF